MLYVNKSYVSIEEAAQYFEQSGPAWEKYVAERNAQVQSGMYGALHYPIQDTNAYYDWKIWGIADPGMVGGVCASIGFKAYPMELELYDIKTQKMAGRSQVSGKEKLYILCYIDDRWKIGDTNTVVETPALTPDNPTGWILATETVNDTIIFQFDDAQKQMILEDFNEYYNTLFIVVPRISVEEAAKYFYAGGPAWNMYVQEIEGQARAGVYPSLQYPIQDTDANYDWKIWGIGDPGVTGGVCAKIKFKTHAMQMKVYDFNTDTLIGEGNYPGQIKLYTLCYQGDGWKVGEAEFEQFDN
jgi:hypothetical protein